MCAIQNVRNTKFIVNGNIHLAKKHFINQCPVKGPKDKIKEILHGYAWPIGSDMPLGGVKEDLVV